MNLPEAKDFFPGEPPKFEHINEQILEIMFIICHDRATGKVGTRTIRKEKETENTGS